MLKQDRGYLLRINEILKTQAAKEQPVNFHNMQKSLCCLYFPLHNSGNKLHYSHVFP